MTVLKLEKDETVHLREHYESVAFETLQTLWTRKWRIFALLTVALVLTCLALVVIGPRYTAEAVIRLNFIREEPATGAKSQPTATVEAASIVDSAARIVRSRATAGAVVTRLGLDKDPAFARQSLTWRVLTGVRSAFGLAQTMPSSYDLAVNELMRRVSVTNDPRSYLISVSVTSGNPGQSASLANGVAVEYLRGQLLQQLAEAYAATERELADLSSVYGARHPSYVNGQAKLARLQTRLDDLRDGALSEDAVRQIVGQSFVAAAKVLVPTGPNIILILGLATGAALLVGIWLWGGGGALEKLHRLWGRKAAWGSIARVGDCICPMCGSLFTQNRGWQIFCSARCRTRSYQRKVRAILRLCPPTGGATT